MNVRFVKCSPTQNMTILVTDPVPRADQSAVAAKLLEYGSVYAEQAGFLETPADPAARARLQMAGGEFCGNATMCLAAYVARNDGLADGAEADLPLEVSGAPATLTCHVRREGSAYRCTVAMPLPTGVEPIFDNVPAEASAFLPGGCTLVRLPGIAHLIVPGRPPKEGAEAFLRTFAGSLDEDAVGLIFFDEPNRRIDPLVYDKSVNSMVWEHGCGSGTAATAAYLAQKTREDVCLPLAQPGGTITVRAATRSGAITRLTITGSVRIAAEGTAYLDD